MAEGVTHISLPTQEIRSRETGENRKTNEQTRTKLGVTKSRGRYCNIICMCGLSLAWVTSENSTMLLESDILRLFFTGPYLMLPRFSARCLVLTAPPWIHANFSYAACLSALQPPTPSASLLSNYQLLSWVASSTLVRLPVPLPGTARFHVQESFVWFRAKTDSSALAAYPHSATYLPLLPLSFILNKLQYDLTSKKKQEHLQEVKTELTKF